MENRQDLGSILPFLPLKLESSSLVWPNQVIEALRSLSKGPSHSLVDSGEVLFLAISDLRNSLSLSSLYLAPSTADGYALFFDEFLSRAEAAKWFGETLPMMASLLLRFPALLESHYHYADIVVVGFETGLRLLEPQESSIVFLNQELIAALLSCSFFCLFPTSNRGVFMKTILKTRNTKSSASYITLSGYVPAYHQAMSHLNGKFSLWIIVHHWPLILLPIFGLTLQSPFPNLRFPLQG